MIAYLEVLRSKNETLFYFCIGNFVFALILILFSFFDQTEILGVNSLYKPIKFALSTGIYCVAIIIFGSYLNKPFNINLSNGIIITTLGFEVTYISFQAFRGQLSHYNISTPVYSFLFSLMAFAASVATLWTAYIGYLFCTQKFTELETHYLWGIRLGILIFVIFSFQGFLMGSRMSHTVGASDGVQGLPFLNWSRKYGDLRISHFLGMHALQIIPLSAFYIFKSSFGVFSFSFIYLCLTSFVLYLSLIGRSLF